MNKAITDGLALMPPPFSAGLNLWSREDGGVGQGSYDAQPNAAYVPADQDFGGCLEVQKAVATQKLRCFQQIPMVPGMYLRVTARVKCLSGNLPSVRIAGYAAAADGSNITTAVQVGPSVAITSYGAVVTVQAIVGAGNRGGVDMIWGPSPAYGHFGLDLIGATGGVVRIDDIEIEDVTEVFLRDMVGLVDVRDYGARGDGITDDTAAFAAADADADGRTVVVPEGSFAVAGNLTIDNPVRFEGTLVMPAGARLVCTRNYDLDTYASAFGSELEGFRKALQALFYFTDHVTLDLSGRRIDLTGPLDVAAIAGLASFNSRRVLRNGQLNAVSGDWDTGVATSVATYSTSLPRQLTGVANVANIAVGARVSGTGVGREVYVTARNVGAGTLELSQPLFAAAGTRTFTFERYQYLLDFSGFDGLSKFEIHEVELACNGRASGVMLARGGLTFKLNNCVVNRPKDRGLTSPGSGCQGMFVDQCQFLSNEQAMPSQDRSSVALNVNANDTKIRDNRVVRFATFAVMAGSGHMFIGNHFFQGDDQPLGIRKAGIVFTSTHARSLMTGNYIDNCFVEWSNEHDAEPDFANELSFGGLTITGNIFMAIDVAASFRWLVVTPRGTGHFINGLSVTDNAFRVVNGSIDRVDLADTTFAALNYARFRNITFEANTFHAVNQMTVSPLVIQHTQASAAETWVVDGGDYLPFGSWARNVTAVVPNGAITNGSNVAQYILPHSYPEAGPTKSLVNLRWGTAVKGAANVTLRCDNSV
jgi:hypothetical protein